MVIGGAVLLAVCILVVLWCMCEVSSRCAEAEEQHLRDQADRAGVPLWWAEDKAREGKLRMDTPLREIERLYRAERSPR